MTSAMLAEIDRIDAAPFQTAYQQLRAAERTFVDQYVGTVEETAVKEGVRLQAVLERPLPANLSDRARNMLASALVRAAISDRVRTLAEDMELSEYKTLKELRCLAYSNIGNYMVPGFDGELMFDFSQCTPEQMAAVKAFEIEDKPRGGRKMKLTLHDKTANLANLMRYQGMLDGDGSHWKASNAKTVEIEDATGDGAADYYARMIESV